MAKFLNTSATSFYLEELIKGANERLLIISPYLKFNEKVRELLEDKDRMKIDIRIVYGKNELHPDEMNWLKSLLSVRCSFCKNLHAKCYLNETQAIISSMNLYEFSQVNNNEMGVLISREDDPDLFKDAYTEAQRIIRISDELKISVDLVDSSIDSSPGSSDETVNDDNKMVSTTQLAKKQGCSSKEMFSRLLEAGFVCRNEETWELTEAGKTKGGVMKQSKRFGDYITWPLPLSIE